MVTEAPLLEVRNLHFSYNAYPGAPLLLNGVSLSVRPGTCLCLMGMNGCGKSTLIDCVLGALHPLSGEVLLGGRLVPAMSAREVALRASYVPQVHDRSFPYPVQHVVMMGLTAHQKGFAAPDPCQMHRVYAALKACGIESLAQRPYTSLSGGEMQMVMLARALVQQAPLIVMDEPTAHLDFRNELLFLETVEQLVRGGETAVLMATHSPNQAFHLARAGVSVEVALMCAGRIVACGAPEAVLTEESLRRTFLVEACVAQLQPQGGEGSLRQIVPLRTIARAQSEGGVAQGDAAAATLPNDSKERAIDGR